MRRSLPLVCGVFVCVSLVRAADPPDESTRLKLAAAMRVLKDSSGPERITALQDIAKLGQAGKPAAKLVGDACFDPSAKVRTAAMDALEKIWPEMYEAGVALLRDNEDRFSKSEKREKACQMIAGLTENADVGIPFLLAHLKAHLEKDNDFFGVNSALSANVEALNKLAPENKTYHKTLIVAVTSPGIKPRHRCLAITTLGDLGQEHPALRRQFLPTLKQGLVIGQLQRDQSAGPAIQVAAIDAMGKFGKDARIQLSLLKKLKQDRSDQVRKAAAAAIESIEGDK